ncbi:unnamed protein product [Cuscuta europaea]|uniref:HAT C-terminal dimerisation domain-containing protein n=1 Tax=Cuscuta europaea TaxID=41803 RepID=A0A9P1ELT7_CUSEU|nr:unnamed protein product [Cuscuta europaea]
MNIKLCGLTNDNDQKMSEVLSLMRTKYIKYFSKLNELNPLIIIGLVLDPRFKLNHVKDILEEDLKWVAREVEQKVNQIKQLLFLLYEEYEEKSVKKRKANETSNTNFQLKTQRLKEGSSSSSGKSGSSHVANKYVTRWSKRVTEIEEEVVEHEVDRYLKDKVMAITETSVEEEGGSELLEEELAENYRSFDLLRWWKMNGNKYPVLALIAKDLFVVQVSTVASESAFSTGGRVIDAFRSSLTPKSVEALICMQNWLRGDNIITNFEDEPCVEELEFYENIEEELRNMSSSKTSRFDPTNKAKGPIIVTLEGEDNTILELGVDVGGDQEIFLMMKNMMTFDFRTIFFVYYLQTS